MAYTDFPTSGLIRLYTRTGAGFSSSGDGTDITGWTDDSSSATNAGLATAAAPSHDATPGGGTLGPAAYHNGATPENGFAPSVNLSSDTTWTFGCVLRADSFGTFRNIFSSQGGAGEGSLYANASGQLTYQAPSGGGSSFYTMSTATVYTVIFVSNGTNYECFVNGSSVWTGSAFTGGQGGPSILETSAYGGTGAGWDGHWWAWFVYNSDETANVSTLHTYLLEEAEGPSGTSGSGTPTLPAVTGSGSGSTVAGGTGSGSPVLPVLVASGAGGVEVAASGSPSLGPASSSGAGTVPRTGSGSPTLPIFTASGTGGDERVASGSPTLAAIIGSGEIGIDLTDSFDGDRDLVGWAALGTAAIPSSNVRVANDRLLIEVDDNTGDITTWFNEDTGRLEYRLTTFPFELIVRNIGIGVSAAATQTSPTIVGNPYNFCFVQVNGDPSNPGSDYVHVAVGIRGSTAFGGSNYTIETKTKRSGSSSSTQTDNGTDSISVTRADIKILGSSGGTITAEWRPATGGSWSPLTIPGTHPTFGSTVAFGFGAYAFGTAGVPFVGTIDSIDLNGTSVAISLPSPITGSGAGDVDVGGFGSTSLPIVTITSSGSVPRSGSAITALPSMVASGVVDVDVSGSGSLSLPAMSAIATSSSERSGSGSPDLPAIISEGAGFPGTGGSGATALPAVTASGAGDVDHNASGSPSLPVVVSTGSGVVLLEGSAAGTLPAVTSSGTATGREAIGGSGSTDMPTVTLSATGSVSAGSPQATGRLRVISTGVAARLNVTR